MSLQRTESQDAPTSPTDTLRMSNTNVPNSCAVNLLLLFDELEKIIQLKSTHFNKHKNWTRKQAPEMRYTHWHL